VSSYDSASAFSGDAKDPSSTYPRAMFLTVLAMALTYMVPIAVATGAAPRADYCDGCLVSIADDVIVFSVVVVVVVLYTLLHVCGVCILLLLHLLFRVLSLWSPPANLPV
jgi:amino acid transporter